ncbi:MAG: hypothetical protein RI958_995 [Actinomycetota bacterium]|jgi:hypothetical protein
MGKEDITNSSEHDGGIGDTTAAPTTTDSGADAFNSTNDRSAADESTEPDDGMARVDSAEPTSDAGAQTAVRTGPSSRLERVLANMATEGVLRIHHISRDIDVVCDGFNALRVVAHFGGQSAQDRLDEVSPFDSDATHGWTALRYRGVVAVSWVPLVDQPARDLGVVFDPN